MQASKTLNNTRSAVRASVKPAAPRAPVAPVAFRKSAFVGESVVCANRNAQVSGRGELQVRCANLKALRDRIDSIGNTKKITDAMKLVAAAKVRRAQEAVQNGRPFAENLVKVMFGVNSRIQGEDVDTPLTDVRPVKTTLLVVCSGDRGLCGGFNNKVIKATEQRKEELEALGVKVKLCPVGKKASKYFTSPNRPPVDITKIYDMGAAPTTKEAQAIADEVFSTFVSEEVDKVEIIYTRFVSLIASKPVVQSLLPLSQQGTICDVNGVCVDPEDDELFRLTTEAGQLSVEKEEKTTDTEAFDSSLLFEQEPAAILDALLPLYLNSSLLRALQDSLASELAARMQAMNAASDNAKELKRNITLVYQRQRQAKITAELIELTAGSG